MKHNVGILHPGAMGISVAATVQNSGHAVYWVSEGRSQESRDRAAKYDLVDTENLNQLCQTCDLIISVCPPAAAEDVAHEVLACSYEGLYLDANAISPQRAERIGRVMSQAGVTFVDGGIIGGPAWEPESTWLYLSGAEAQRAAAFFSAGPLETGVIGEYIGKASALKMCYAAYTKGSTALLCAIQAAAESLDVRGELAEQWSRDWEEFAEEAENRARRVTAKAWRFAGEMDEIAATFESAGVPGNFHEGAGIVYRRLAHFKGAAEQPALEEVLSALYQPAGGGVA